MPSLDSDTSSTAAGSCVSIYIGVVDMILPGSNSSLYLQCRVRSLIMITKVKWWRCACRSGLHLGKPNQQHLETHCQLQEL